ncbi:MAG TPA: cellulase family glycosylhydrolase [Planctomycetaceae bacterium]|jgi:hypothetical protein|nr:cellulase family glycosylhydrolase [Planctomycetaceae bacterium]
MKLLTPCVLGFFLFCLPSAKGDEVVDPWEYWSSNTARLWGANIYQQVDAQDRTKWGPLLQRSDLEDLRSAGANYVNFSVPGPFDVVSGRCNADDWRHLKQQVAWAKAAKLKVVIAFRTAPGRNEADITDYAPVQRDLLDDPHSPNIAKFYEMWQTVAKEFANEPAVVGFDLLVEPHAPVDSNEYAYRKSQRWHDVAACAINAIRSQNARTPILVEPDAWAAAADLNDADGRDPMAPVLAWTMPAGDRLVCAVHQYRPDDYTQKALGPLDVTFGDLQTALEEIPTWRVQNPNVPVCVNEFGVRRDACCAALFLSKELSLLRTQNLNRAVWLWQVADPQTNHDFDVRIDPCLYAAVRADWQANAAPRQPDRKDQKARTRPASHSARVNLRTRGDRTKRSPAPSSCDCDPMLYDPELKKPIPVADAQAEFHRLSDVTRSQPEDLRLIAAQKASRRARHTQLAREAAAPAVPDDGHSRAIGFWPKDKQLLFTQSTAIRHVIVFPDAVGSNFNSFLYQTSTNRSNKGAEAHIAFTCFPPQAPSPAEFWIFDWSLCNHRHIRQVPVCKMDRWVFPITVQGLKRKGLLVVNQTRLITGTTWKNCVYLGVFDKGKLVRYDAVYSNPYTLDDNSEQQPDCCYGFWGPEIETFQDLKSPINAMGFTGCWMIQDGKPIALDAANTCKHDEHFGLKMFYKTPNRDFLVD